MELENLEIFNQLAEHLAIEGAELAEQVVCEGKDSKRLYRGKIRHEIAERDKYTCFYGKEEVEGRYHIDHVIPYT